MANPQKTVLLGNNKDSVRNVNRRKHVEMILNPLYYSLNSPASFGGKEKLFLEAKRNDEQITRYEVENWLSSQLAYTLHKPVSLNFKTRPVLVYYVDEQWQLDLVDLSKLSRYNSGYKYLLVCIDILSRFAWIEPLKSKTAKELKEVIEKIFLRGNRQPKLIQTDKGTEFLNSLVKNMLRSRKIRLFTTNSERKASVVERLNRTMKGIMFKYFTKENTRRYIDVMPNLVARYNNSYHRSIKMKPNEVHRGNEAEVWINLYEGRLHSHEKHDGKNKELNIGDIVRISIEKTVFQKRYDEIWTEEIFIVTHRIQGNPITYKLKDQSNEAINGMFYSQELQKVAEPETYRIEKVIRKKKSADGSLLYYVKWKGYSEKFNSFVTEQDLKRV